MTERNRTDELADYFRQQAEQRATEAAEYDRRADEVADAGYPRTAEILRRRAADEWAAAAEYEPLIRHRMTGLSHR